MASLVKDDFTALGLTDYGVEIHIDDLRKEEILAYIDKENFNAIKYLKQDYWNFKKYIGKFTMNKLFQMRLWKAIHTFPLKQVGLEKLIFII